MARRMIADGTFTYFGYGSNMLSQRIRIANPSAKKINIGKLQDYKLNFNYKSSQWHGSVATVSESPGRHVWGVVWELSKSDLASLDSQENVYKPINVTVRTPDGDELTCRTYQLLNLDNDDPRPSARYLNVLIRGGIENGLPDDYLEFLHNIEHNGYNGPIEFFDTHVGQSLPSK